MQAYRITSGSNIAGLERFSTTPRPLGAHDVRVRVHAVALNYRDLMVARGEYRVSSSEPVIVCSDAAGEVVATGAGVTRFKVGDRVAGAFFPAWMDGEPTPENSTGGLGAEVDGVLAEEIVLHETAAVPLPSHLKFVEAATLPCAGVTAWNTLFEEGGLKPGNTVLLLGTGGVSIWALQLAKAAGLRTIITSSSDEKLQRASRLGADATINYRQIPAWQDEVLRLTHGRGVDLVAEVGGQGTLTRSIASTRMGGHIAMIGGVSGFGASDLLPLQLIGGAKRISGIFVGSRVMFERLARFVEIAQIRPVIDRVFPFDEAAAAYAYLEAAKHFGKVVVQVAA
ncbi:alcohol dehydrogenase [mine drainage metagenome]|uniref:Alcohol dehydrogenase n=1 Tax=mine drainage metagenome TaxID=410659 RepID=A0A1J5RQ89_9ZZZZ